jgi:hypothetical protein
VLFGGVVELQISPAQRLDLIPATPMVFEDCKYPLEKPWKRLEVTAGSLFVAF